MKLICLPFAGGSFSNYYCWKKYLLETVDLIPVELAGRGIRYSVPFYKNINEAIDDIYEQVVDTICQEPFIIFGHSMGCILAYELCKCVEKNGYSSPKHVIMSGNGIPSKVCIDPIHDMPEKEFIEAVKKFNGIPEVILNNKDCMDYYIPILRSDFRLIELYEDIQKYKPIASDLTVFGGTEDVFSKEELVKWKEYTSGKFDLKMFRGGHFFINTNMEEVVKSINAIIRNCK